MALGVEEGERLAATELLAEALEVTLSDGGEELALADCVADSDGERDADGEGDGDGDSEGDGERDADGEGDGDGEGDAVADCECDGVAVGVVVGEGVVDSGHTTRMQQAPRPDQLQAVFFSPLW